MSVIDEACSLACRSVKEWQVLDRSKYDEHVLPIATQWAVSEDAARAIAKAGNSWAQSMRSAFGYKFEADIADAVEHVAAGHDGVTVSRQWKPSGAASSGTSPKDIVVVHRKPRHCCVWVFSPKTSQRERSKRWPAERQAIQASFDGCRPLRFYGVTASAREAGTVSFADIEVVSADSEEFRKALLELAAEVW